MWFPGHDSSVPAPPQPTVVLRVGRRYALLKGEFPGRPPPCPSPPEESLAMNRPRLGSSGLLVFVLGLSLGGWPAAISPVTAAESLVEQLTRFDPNVSPAEEREALANTLSA